MMRGIEGGYHILKVTLPNQIVEPTVRSMILNLFVDDGILSPLSWKIPLLLLSFLKNGTVCNSPTSEETGEEKK